MPRFCWLSQWVYMDCSSNGQELYRIMSNMQAATLWASPPLKSCLPLIWERKNILSTLPSIVYISSPSSSPILNHPDLTSIIHLGPPSIIHPSSVIFPRHPSSSTHSPSSSPVLHHPPLSSIIHPEMLTQSPEHLCEWMQLLWFKISKVKTNSDSLYNIISTAI